MVYDFSGLPLERYTVQVVYVLASSENRPSSPPPYLFNATLNSARDFGTRDNNRLSSGKEE